MKLSAKAIKAITTKTRNRLALEMDCSVYTVDRWIANNDENGDLTKAKSVQIISEETDLTDAEILEEESKAKETAR